MSGPIWITGKTPTVTTKAMVIQTKSPVANIDKELFAIVNTYYPDYLGSGMYIIPSGIDHKMGYSPYT